GSQAIFHRETFTMIKCPCICVEALLHIVFVDAFSPAVSEFLFNLSPGEVQPTLIDVGTKFVSTRHPDHHWSGICNDTGANFTLPHNLLRFLTLGDIRDHANDAFQVAVSVKECATVSLQPHDPPIGPDDSIDDLKLRALRRQLFQSGFESFLV